MNKNNFDDSLSSNNEFMETLEYSFEEEFSNSLEEYDPPTLLSFPDPGTQIKADRKKTVAEKETVDVTVILNIWKREYLKEQLASIIGQTVVPKEIWIIHYEHHVNTQAIADLFSDEYSGISIIHSDKNLKYFGRFSIAINSTTKFTWLIDDDIIPGKLWLEKCVNRCEALNAIVTCSGRIIPKNDFQPENLSGNKSVEHFIGDVKYHDFMNFSPEEVQVDYACNSYFFKTEWMSAYWSTWPATFLSGEDMHLAATCKVKLGVKTYVLAQTDFHSSGNTKKFYGADAVATWRKADFIPLREKILRFHILEQGWRPILWD